MHRIISAGFETLLAAIILVPILLIMEKTMFHNLKKVLVYSVFALYLAAMYSIVGLPDITYMRLGFSFNFIPFAGMVSDLKNSVLNVILFVPLGILLPVTGDKFRTMKNTILFGFFTTLTIEILQIFTFRATDVNDIITNVTGTIIGFFIAKILMKKLPRVMIRDQKSYEVFLISGLVFVVMFTVQPLLFH